MEAKSLVTAISTVMTSAAGALIAVYLKDWLEERRFKRSDLRVERRTRVRTDRATYNQRLTILIRSHLGAYIRSGKWFSDEADLRRLVVDLENGNYEHFLDKEVNRLWCKLIRKTVILAKRRLSGTITKMDIRFYNVIRQEWESAAKRSFGPFPRPREIHRVARGEQSAETTRRAA